jgi:phospholipid/cholesterol/gamma-HCH transport system substrate-binding protein
VTGRAAAVALAAAALLVAGCGDHAPAAKTATDLPAAGTFEFGALFAHALPETFDAGSPVRVRGISVGTVTSVVGVGGGTSVQMRIREYPKWPGAWPVRTDARVVVAPRIFLEGHFFVDLRPGSAGAPPLKPGGRVLPGHARIFHSPF